MNEQPTTFDAGGCTYDTATRLCTKHHCGPFDPCLVPGCPHCDKAAQPEALREQRKRALQLKLEARRDVLLQRVARDTKELSVVIKKLRKMERAEQKEREEGFES